MPFAMRLRRGHLARPRADGVVQDGAGQKRRRLLADRVGKPLIAIIARSHRPYDRDTVEIDQQPGAPPPQLKASASDSDRRPGAWRCRDFR